MPLGRKAWLFCGSDRGGQRAAVLYTLIQTTRLNDVNPQAWLADVIAALPRISINQSDELRPQNWQRMPTPSRLDQHAPRSLADGHCSHL
jgi:transposase